jgi:hypothetical protein
MKNYGKVISTVKPEAIVVDDNSVWLHTDIKETEKEGEKLYEYTMQQYTKDEYNNACLLEFDTRLVKGGL